MPKSTCAAIGCTNPGKTNGLCPKHYQRARRHGGDPNAVVETRRPAGSGTCAAPDCQDPARTKDLCKAHYMWQWRYGNLDVVKRPKRPTVCSIDGCNRPHKAHDYCEPHYDRYKRGADMTAPLRSYRSTEGACEAPGCSDPILADRLCSGHYAQRQAGKPLTEKRVYLDKTGPCAVSACDKPIQSEGLCQAHYNRRLKGDPDWDRPIAAKAPSGEGHLNKDGYRIVQDPHTGRPRGQHVVMAEELLGRPLAKTEVNGRLRTAENVHHVNGDRAGNTVDGPFVMDDRGRLRSGNLEVWSSSQPAGQEIGPKLDWALDMLERYADVAPVQRERLRVLSARLSGGAA